MKLKLSLFSRILLLITLPVWVGLTSCKEDQPEPESSPARDSAPRMSINILPLAVNMVSDGVAEKINSLRIIILSENPLDDDTSECYVEYNQFFDFYGQTDGNGLFTGPGELASTFRFIITRNSVPGIKRFYLIANEREIENINFQTDEELPENITAGMSLHDFLNNYGADFMEDLLYTGQVPEQGEPKGEEFETLVNCIYYTPQFNQPTTGDGSATEEIFLPYTSQYTFALATQGDIDSGNAPANAVNILNTKMYLVPCATKFRFCLENYRREKVVIPSFKLSGIAPNMFLFAQVNSPDTNKNFGAQKGLWWVDWLAAVSEASHAYQDPDENLGFSTSFGWINNFDVPDDVYEGTDTDTMDGDTRYGVVELLGSGSTPWEVDPNTGTPVQGPPGRYYTGYFYFPESRYMVDFPQYDDNGNSIGNASLQAYYLKLQMIAGENGDLSTVKDTQIGNLGSLFRNTHTYITIKMRDANDVGAYAQVEKWEESHTNGTVSEEEIPDE